MKPASDSVMMRLLAVAAAVACAVGIAFLQPGLTAKVKKVKLRDDVTILPPPRDVRILSFGYHAATADGVWASLLVEQGIRSQERRPFSGITRYIDAIIELDPKHRAVYRFVDSLLVFKTVGIANEDDARAARAYLERGTKEFPYDNEVWLHYGQFLAFLAPSFLKDPAEVDRWRRDGAFAIAHAVDLGPDAGRSLTASTLLGRAGETKAAIAQLQRAYALSDDPDTRQQIVMKLRYLGASTDVAGVVDAVEDEWHTRFPHLSRGETLLLGPHRDPALCAGPDSSRDARCPSDWTAATSAAQ